MLPQASCTLLHPYLQCEHSVAPVAKVGLPIMRAVPQYFTAWFAKHLIAGLFGIASPLPPLPLYILVVGGCYSLDVCSHLGSFYLPVVFSLLYVSGFHYYYCYHYFILVHFDWLPLNVSECDCCHCYLLSYFILFISSLGLGLVTGLWILLATGVIPSCRGWVAGQP